MRVLLVYCHPVPESFAAAIRDEAISALGANGHEVRLIDLHAEGFDPVMSADERRHYNDRAPADPALAPHIEALKWAEGIVFVYPTWWYGLPAMLKGWFDRVWALKVAFDLAPKGGIVSTMSNIRLVAVFTTCGAPWWQSFLVGQPGRKTILRGIRVLFGWRCRTIYQAHYLMDVSTPRSRAAYLAKVRSRLSRI
ncbi:MAG: NAD(P)H-dependent oxidoreductase [Mesorhizobium sp.]